MSDITKMYNVRNKVDNDTNFILSTFLRGIYYGNSWFSKIPKAIFMENYKHVAEALVNPNKSVIVVACLKDEPDVIIGYSILSLDYQTVHFVYVKEKWRRLGIGRSLVPQHPESVSHLTELGYKLLPKLKECIFNPFKT